ncbi:hypothetical protein H5410_016356, partial [Solanum commersonii]
ITSSLFKERDLYLSISLHNYEAYNSTYPDNKEHCCICLIVVIYIILIASKSGTSMRTLSPCTRGECRICYLENSCIPCLLGFN